MALKFVKSEDGLRPRQRESTYGTAKVATESTDPNEQVDKFTISISETKRFHHDDFTTDDLGYQQEEMVVSRNGNRCG